ncbi:hypothetical protein HMPREF9126_1562 [Parvimonas sp. oral taxon 110 str. F0139]|nr:hypothetical protein HMPREF9126_1562 [Parvimonas sp. oral taxon 110 str. F0139]
MKFKKLVLCLFAFSIFLTSCSSNTNNNSNKKVEEESKQKKKTIENVELEEEIKKVEFPENATAVSFRGYNPDSNKIYFSYSTKDSITYATKDLNNNSVDIIYEVKGNELENMFTIHDGVVDDTLYIVKSNTKNLVNNKTYKKNGKQFYEYNFIVVDKDKNVKKYFNEDEASTSGDNQIYSSVPAVRIDGHNLILSTQNHVGNDIIKSFIFKFNIDKAELTLVKEEELNYSNNKFNGKFILFAGGVENNIYYQLVNYNNTDKMENGTAEVYKLISESESKKILELDKENNQENAKQKRLLFLSGDDYLLFTNDLAPKTAKYNTGKVYNLNTMEGTEIPNITVEDIIRELYTINNLYFLNNRSNFYVYNNVGKLLLQKPYNPEEKLASNISVNKDTISYLIKDSLNSKEGELHIIKLKEK